MKIKELRIKTGMNQREFSAFIQIPLWVLEDWEFGRLKLPPYFVDAVVRFCEENINE